VHISTKLNRSHVITGKRALILPAAMAYRYRSSTLFGRCVTHAT